jgi:aryl-alcohol dehydrogenase-like predicted oxidoreductase
VILEGDKYMIYNPLNNTNLRLPIYSLGTMMFGGQTDQAQSLSIMDYAYEKGINLFDTANIYNKGQSEIIVGKALKNRREKIILATKVGYSMEGGLSLTNLSKDHILRSADESLKRLETDYIDLYYMHAPDYNTPIEESLEAMTTLIESGKVKYLGISNFAAWQIADLLAACDKHGFTPPVITQNVYNPITRGIETELIPFLQAHDLSLTIYNPIAAGLLAGKHQKGNPAHDTRFANNAIYYNRYWSDRNFEAIESLDAIAKSVDLSLIELTMRWCATQAKVSSIITGVSRLSQLEQNLQILQGDSLDPYHLSQNILDEINRVWIHLTGDRFGYNR